MFFFKNVKQTSGVYSYVGNYINSFQLIHMAKHDIYPSFQQEVMTKVPTNLIINSGKLIINMKKYNKSSNKLIQKSIFAESNILYKIEKDNDIILTNHKYIFIIEPNIFYSFYSYDNNTNFQLFFKSENSIKYYIYNNINNKYLFSTIEKLK